jgi:hypothetical protein
MSSLEDRLRSELRQIAEGVGQDSLRPLRAPVRRRKTALAGWLAPVTAMAAVIAVIAGVHLAQPARPGASTAMPPYYVTADDVRLDDGTSDEATASVHASATGATLSTVRLPRVGSLAPNQSVIEAVSAAADDQTFLIQDGQRVFVLRIGPDGRSASVSKLPVSLPTAASVALSPDGSTAAIESLSFCDNFSQKAAAAAEKTDFVPDPACDETQIKLISLATGTTIRTWSRRGWVDPYAWISWTLQGQILFVWPGAYGPSDLTGDIGLRLLDVTASGGNLLAARALPVSAGGPWTDAFLTPDGSTIIFSSSSSSSVEAVSASTGKPVNLLAGLSIRDGGTAEGDCGVLSLASGGLHALVMCQSPSVVFGRVDNGQFTPLPGIASTSDDAAW